MSGPADGPQGGTVHIVGAGLAGLACAVALAARGRRVALHEAAGQAGGRCRSLEDAGLGCRIDNGNHFLLAANQAALAYLAVIGARGTLHDPGETVFPFVDLADGCRWRLRPNPGRLPWWLLVPGRRVPGTRPFDYLGLHRLLRAGAEATVADCLPMQGPLWRRFWEPLTVAVLNTAAEEASARLLAATLRATFLAGGAACRPLLARDGLAQSFVEPALAFLAGRGVVPHWRQRLRGLRIERERVVGLAFAQELPLAAGDAVVLAVPPAQARQLLPELSVPEASRPIVNAHYRVPGLGPAQAAPELLGLVGGTAQWLVRRGEVVSITVSAATELVELPAETLAERLWSDTSAALGLDGRLPEHWRVIKERRATIAQTPAAVRQRPGTRTPLGNLLLAGDWTDTGLPATIEGAIRSGQAAAAAVVERA